LYIKRLLEFRHGFSTIREYNFKTPYDLVGFIGVQYFYSFYALSIIGGSISVILAIVFNKYTYISFLGSDKIGITVWFIIVYLFINIFILREVVMKMILARCSDLWIVSK